MATDFANAPPPIEGASSPRQQTPVTAIRRLVSLLARQAAREAIASGVELSPKNTRNAGAKKPNRPVPGRRVIR